MSRLTMFNTVTLDGFFTGSGGDLSWAHNAPDDAEWNRFVEENARGDGVLVFGRMTYEMMAGYWPMPAAQQASRALASRMNAYPKIVYSRTLKPASWANTTLLNEDAVESMRRLKTDLFKRVVA